MELLYSWRWLLPAFSGSKHQSRQEKTVENLFRSLESKSLTCISNSLSPTNPSSHYFENTSWTSESNREYSDRKDTNLPLN